MARLVLKDGGIHRCNPYRLSVEDTTGPPSRLCSIERLIQGALLQRWLGLRQTFTDVKSHCLPVSWRAAAHYLGPTCDATYLCPDKSTFCFLCRANSIHEADGGIQRPWSAAERLEEEDGEEEEEEEGPRAGGRRA